MKPKLGCTFGLTAWQCSMAESKEKPLDFISHAITIVALLLRPATQWTNTFPPLSKVSSIKAKQSAKYCGLTAWQCSMAESKEKPLDFISHAITIVALLVNKSEAVSKVLT
eukprot:CAMPEP_0118956914 /NCGR_PEP_ID=MMETSP1169-20130426/61828_1 /TAXON_ID=36882 /ORGANISM="Pyramimonas obovata, Strain CCMP722" /LENGTH=110 /DNA_ID=CAMNT_0006904965 /DNA_START=247 /DNA_END=579 /DNA_ORIENTATION=-